MIRNIIPWQEVYNEIKHERRKKSQRKKEMSRYSDGNWKVYEYYFMKQQGQFQMGISQYKNVVTALSTIGNNTTHQHYQMSYVTLF